MTNVYRIQLFRWTIEKKEGWVFHNNDQYRQYCLDKGILAFGWPARMSVCPSMNEYEKYVNKMFHNPNSLKSLPEDEQKKIVEGHPYTNHKSWQTAVNAIKNMQKGDLCWTLGGDGRYYLGEIEDTEPTIVDSRLDEYAEYPEMGVFRRCEWHPYELDETPGKVISSLIKGGTLHQVYEVSEYSEHLIYPKKIFPQKDENFYPLLHSDDLEDLLGLYLQSKGYYIFPSTNKNGTALVEYVLINNKTHKKAVIQCKTGADEIADEHIKIFKETYSNYEVFITTIKDKDYFGKNITTIKKEVLKNWAKDNQDLLPLRIKNYLNWSK